MRFENLNKFRDDIKTAFIENETTSAVLDYLEIPKQGDRYQTACHMGDGFNLVVHNDTAMLYCYSHCGSMDIIEFVEKVTGRDYIDTLIFLSEFVDIDYQDYIVKEPNRYAFGEDEPEREEEPESEEEIQKRLEESRANRRKRIEERKVCNNEEDILPECILPYAWNYFYEFDLPIKNWLDEGISEESMKKFGIGYHRTDIATYQDGLGTLVYRPFYLNEVLPQWAAIPCKDRFGKLVGVRIRDFGYQDCSEPFDYHPPERGKYRPISLAIDEEKGRYKTSFKTGSALYGIYENLDIIKDKKRCIIFEGEKSVLKADSFYMGKCPCVATFGSSINTNQLKILQNLGVEEITIAYDYDNDKSKEKIIKIAKGVKQRWPELKVYYLYEGYEEKLEAHDAPIDKGKDTFKELYRKRTECELTEEDIESAVESLGKVEWGDYNPEEREEELRNCKYF